MSRDRRTRFRNRGTVPRTEAQTGSQQERVNPKAMIFSKACSRSTGSMNSKKSFGEVLFLTDAMFTSGEISHPRGQMVTSKALDLAYRAAIARTWRKECPFSV